MLAIVFWACAFLLFYTLVIYPLWMFALSRFEQPVRKDHSALPTVSILVPVYNEAHVIEDKLANCLKIDYPSDRLEIAFASDGSTDNTTALLRESDDPRLTLFDYPDNRGKSATLNETIPRLKGDLVLLTDASGMLNNDVLRSMVPHFGDEQVGYVCGIYHIIKQGRSRMDSAEDSYHGFEMQLRLWEGRYRTTLSGTGALCMLRKEEYEPLPVGVINDDYILPARMALSGKRVIYDQGAHIFDRLSTSIPAVFRRRVRIAYGNWQQVKHLASLLNPLRPYLFLVFVSHKLLRMLLPFLLVLCLVSSYTFSPTLFTMLMAGAGLLLTASLIALALDRYFRDRNPLCVVALVFLNCLAVCWGTARYFSGLGVKW